MCRWQLQSTQCHVFDLMPPPEFLQWPTPTDFPSNPLSPICNLLLFQTRTKYFDLPLISSTKSKNKCLYHLATTKGRILNTTHPSALWLLQWFQFSGYLLLTFLSVTCSLAGSCACANCLARCWTAGGPVVESRESFQWALTQSSLGPSLGWKSWGFLMRCWKLKVATLAKSGTTGQEESRLPETLYA